MGICKAKLEILCSFAKERHPRELHRRECGVPGYFEISGVWDRGTLAPGTTAVVQRTDRHAFPIGLIMVYME